MARGAEVLEMLIPEGGWIITADDYDSIQFLECNPITKEEFQLGFAKYDSWRAIQDKTKLDQKTAILERLGISFDEVELLLK